MGVRSIALPGLRFGRVGEDCYAKDKGSHMRTPKLQEIRIASPVAILSQPALNMPFPS